MEKQAAEDLELIRNGKTPGENPHEIHKKLPGFYLNVTLPKDWFNLMLLIFEYCFFKFPYLANKPQKGHGRLPQNSRRASSSRKNVSRVKSENRS